MPRAEPVEDLLGGVPGAEAGRTVCALRVDHDRRLQPVGPVSQETQGRHLGQSRSLSRHFMPSTNLHVSKEHLRRSASSSCCCCCWIYGSVDVDDLPLVL